MNAAQEFMTVRMKCINPLLQNLSCDHIKLPKRCRKMNISIRRGKSGTVNLQTWKNFKLTWNKISLVIMENSAFSSSRVDIPISVF